MSFFSFFGSSSPKAGSMLAAVSVIAVAANAPAANAQANLAFSGGSGSPLTLTLAAPVSYTVTTTAGIVTAPYFVFQNVGNPFINSGPSVTGTITYRINGGAVRTITGINSGNTSGNLSANDTFINGTFPGVTVGDIVTLASGVLTTTSNVAAVAPANGSFTTFLMNSSTSRISANGTAIIAAPEPGSIAFLGLGFVGIAGSVICKRRSL